MILPVNNQNPTPFFSANKQKKNEKEYTHDTLLPNNLSTRMRIGMDKFTNAITLYSAKGFKGSRNANFYEFLTMGQIPYLIGSGTLIAVFNAANKHYNLFDQPSAKALGNKMALGVVLYGLLKSASKPLVTAPVHWITGIDTERPYAKVNYELPDDIYDTDITNIEYHKVFESVDFSRWDLLLMDPKSGKPRNARYDIIAKKLGMGTNLKDSDQEVKPRIKEIVEKTSAAKSITSYLWAAAGVALAFQKPWESYFNVATLKFWDTKKFAHSMKIFGKSLVESAKAMYKGEGCKYKHAGKFMIYTPLAATVLGVLNVMRSEHKPSKLDSADIIEKERKYVVN